MLASAAHAMPPVSHFYDAGVAALDANNLTEAHDMFLRAVLLAPEWALAHLQLGITDATLDPNSDVARSAFERAVLLAPDNPRCYYYLGLSYIAGGRYAEAAQALQHVVTLRADFQPAWLPLAESLQSADATAMQLIEAYERAAVAKPDDPAINARLAVLYEESGAFGKAEQALLLLVRLHPKAAYNQYELAEFYARRNQVQKAKAAFARATALDPRPSRKMRPLR